MASKPLTLRLKAKNGQHVVNKLTIDSSVEELKSIISELTKIPSRALKLKTGFPPKPLDISDGTKSLEGASIRTGETLIVEEDAKIKAEEEERRTTGLLKAMEEQMASGGGILTRQVVPANNSCLFTSVYFVMNKGKLDLERAPTMRQFIASTVRADPTKYNEAFLGRTNSEYCTWIMNDASWGGAIEISILSSYYSVEIDVVDTQTCRIDKFGEDQQYKQRVLLLYDGIHYDPLMLEPLDPSDSIKTIYPISNDVILSQALELANEAKSSRQFTDVANFTLKCLVCNKGLQGEAGAQEHAKTTGHINFGEVWTIKNSKCTEKFKFISFLIHSRDV